MQEGAKVATESSTQRRLFRIPLSFDLNTLDTPKCSFSVFGVSVVNRTALTPKFLPSKIQVAQIPLRGETAVVFYQARLMGLSGSFSWLNHCGSCAEHIIRSGSKFPAISRKFLLILLFTACFKCNIDSLSVEYVSCLTFKSIQFKVSKL